MAAILDMMIKLEIDPIYTPSPKNYSRIKHEVDQTTRSRDIII